MLIVDLAVKQITDAVAEVIAERGEDFIYEIPAEGACMYSTDDGRTGSCLYGAALIEKLGVEYDPNWEGMNIFDILGEGPNVGRWEGEALRDLQIIQDQGNAYEKVQAQLEFYRRTGRLP